MMQWRRAGMVGKLAIGYRYYDGITSFVFSFLFFFDASQLGLDHCVFLGLEKFHVAHPRIAFARYRVS